MMTIVSEESKDLFESVVAALDTTCQYLSVTNKDRMFNRVIFRRKPKDMQAELTSARDALKNAWDRFNTEGRLKMCAVYDEVNTSNYKGKTPHRSLMRMYYLEFHLMRFSNTILSLTQKCLDIEMTRQRPVIHWPTRFFLLALPNSMRNSRSSNKEDDHRIEQDVDPDLMEEPDDFETEQRDPDHGPPRHIGHLLGRLIVWPARIFKNPAFYFAFKASILIILIALPGFLRSSAGWFYKRRGIWSVIMAALTQAPFTGDTIFAYIWRIAGTFIGAVLGMLIWYIGNGSGKGQPFGFAAIMAAALPLIMIIRLKFVYINPQPAIILVLTFSLIVGYSWQDSHMPSLVNFGVGWNIAWRRFLVVLIGITAAFIWTFLPKPVTGRQVVRRRLACGVFEIGNIYVQVSNFARNPHRKKSDEETIRQMVVRANTKLLVLNQRLIFANFEPPLQGPWPKDRYVRIFRLQRELLDLMVSFVNNLAHMDESSWRKPLLRRTGWFDRELVGDCLAVMFMTANAIKTGGALPQLVPCPLLDRFARRMDQIQETQTEGALPQKMSQETLEDPGYASFAVGCVISFAIVSRVDEMLTVAKELVGERWHSSHWVNRHDYERLDVV